MTAPLEITIKGAAGSGKTRLMKWLAALLANQGHVVITIDGGERAVECRGSQEVGLLDLYYPAPVTIKTEVAE